MKKHNTVKVVLITLLVFLLLSWIFPAAYYSGEYVDQGRVQMGLAELFNYPLTSLTYFGHIALFLILVGGFYGILYKIPAYRTFLDWVVAKFEGKEKLFIAIVVVLLGFGVSIAGLQVAYALFIPLFVSIILLMGYDKVVATLTVVGGIAAGLIGSTYAYSNLNLLDSILSLDLDYQVGVRFVILLVAIILVIFNVFMYISKYMKTVKVSEPVRKKETVKEEVVLEEVEMPKKTSSNTKKTSNNKKSSNSKKSSKSSSSKSGTNKSTRGRKSPNKAALKQEDIIVVKESVVNDNRKDDYYLVPTRVEVTHSVWPFVTGFALLFILVVIAFIPWGDTGFKVSFFTDITKKFTEFELFGFPIFSKIYGGVKPFGGWTIVDFFLPMFILTLLLVIIYRVKLDDVFDGFVNGVKKALAPAFIVFLVYTALVINTFHPYQLSIYKVVLGWSKGFNIVTATITGILSTLFNVDASYIFQSILPYYTSVVTNTKNYEIAGIIYQSMYGFASLFAPTSIVLMATLSYLKVGYKDWLKNAWKLLLELFVVLLIIFIVLTAM